ncbi:MAG: ion transporter [Terrimicrobiaceae bacterium]
MGEQDLVDLKMRSGVAGWRLGLAHLVELPRVQHFVVGVILFNAAILGLETSPAAMERFGLQLRILDKLCLAVFLIEIGSRLLAYRLAFFRSGWNVFDFAVVGVALIPGAGPWAVLRSLRVLRVLRLLTVIPSLRKVVAAFLHAIPGLGGVMLLMGIFLYTAAVLATNLFGAQYPQWFGTLGGSLFSLFQILTLEGWADMARTIMQTHAWAPFFFIPCIMIATFTVLNLFIGIIVSTMQELAMAPEKSSDAPEPVELIKRIEADLKALRAQMAGN